MKKSYFIRLTQGKFAIVDMSDLVFLSGHKWYAKKNKSIHLEYGKYYAARHQRINGVGYTIYMHREITNCPKNMEVDHKDENSLCNRRDNLIVCTRKEHNRKRYQME